MKKIVYLMGRSCSGKDTIYKKLLEQKIVPLVPIVPYTTRPKRDHETDGVEYHFTDETGFWALKDAGRVVEDRSYDTVQGLWRYFTVLDGISIKDGAVTTDTNDEDRRIMIGTLESYEQIKTVLGEEILLPIYIDLDDGVRLERALLRERSQENPHYDEMCRRYLADLQDFSDENLERAGVTVRFMNDDLQECVERVLDYISANGN